MSLGPPFDDSGRGARRAAGAGLVIALGAAIVWVLMFSDRAMGPGVVVRVSMATTGALRVGDKVRLAGRDVGEVRGAVRVHDDRGATGATETSGSHVELTVFVEREWARELRVNSELFVATPSVLGEAYLEIGPPPHHAPPGPPVRGGELLVGVDPPEIDKFLVRSEESVRRALALLRENRPALDELLNAGDELLATLSGLPADRGQLRRIADQTAAAFDAGGSLLAALRDARAVPRIRAAAHDLSAIADRAGPELSSLGARLDRALDRIDQLSTLFDADRRARIAGAVATVRRAVATGQHIAADVRALAASVARGEGTIGGIMTDVELFDDLHETHRILKSQPWTFILKPNTPGGKRPAGKPQQSPQAPRR
jgi:phospholipid/cholesterol/gamma-HCH transport system substrate-binding protein